MKSHSSNPLCKNLFEVFVCLTFTIIFFLPEDTFAQGIRIGRDNEFIGQTTGGALRMNTTPSRSYCCEVESTSSIAVFSTMEELQYEAPGIPIIIQSPFTDFVRRERVDNVSSRVCFSSSDQTTVTGYVLGIEIGSGTVDLKTRCDDTTLFCGYNTSASNFNFLEISNLLGKPTGVGSDSLITDPPRDESNDVKVVVTAIDSISGLRPLDKFGLTVQSGARRDVDIHTPAGPGSFGAISVQHDGPQDSLRAYLSQYKLDSDGSLLQVSREECRPRKSL